MMPVDAKFVIKIVFMPMYCNTYVGHLRFNSL